VIAATREDSGRGDASSGYEIAAPEFMRGRQQSSNMPFTRTLVSRGLTAMATRLVGILIVAAATWAEGREAGDISTKLQAVRSYLEDGAAGPGFSGVVLVGRGDEVVFQQAYGFADADLRVPMRIEQRFRIGSLTKPVTASAVLVAVDRGLLGLDMPACRWLPACLGTWDQVTLRHLLTHTSGIPDHFGDLEAVPVRETVAELRRVLESLPDDEPLRAAAGTEYGYSNFNYVLLGAVLEQVAGKPWETLLREWVFEPLELRTMAYDDVYAIIDDRARGYERDDDSLGLRNIDYDDHAAYAAGGLLSTAGDLFLWSRGMLTAKLFSPQLVEESLTPYREDYGYGWQIRRFFERSMYNHTGAIDGFASHLAHYPDDELTIVVLSNVEDEPAILRACDVAARLFDWPVITRADGPDLTPRQRCGLER
jgi:CubicO group peptidase (beta-lactamase class C family)